MSPFYVKIDGLAVAFRSAEALEEAVRNALAEWYEAAECPHFGQTEDVCCENHPQARFKPCGVCHAIAKASKDDQAWLESGTDMLPYKIQLPASPTTAARQIEAGARA